MLQIIFIIFYGLRKRFYLFLDHMGKSTSLISYDMPLRLKRFFKLADISILDIGARRGPLSEFQFFAPFARLILCEPDEKEARRLQDIMKSEKKWKDVTVIADAIHSTARRVTLHITEEEGLSSLLEPDIEMLSQFYVQDKGKKYSLENWEVKDHVDVPALSLDAAAEKYRFSDISLLKVDTQGTELDILKSGIHVVLPSVVGVYIEAEFLPLYKHQALFGNVHDFLQSNGFRLVDLKRSCLRRSFTNRPIYSKRELTWAHALYLREANADASSLTVLQKIKIACVAAHFEFFDYALWLLRDSEVLSFLRRQGLDGVDEDIHAYASRIWRSIKKRNNWSTIRRMVGDSWNDRNYER